MVSLHWQSIAQIQEKLVIHALTLYNWRVAWSMQAKLVLVFYKKHQLD